ncbi:MAG: restriction endonuclease, partial [Candidatus Pacebacteria bacterium]|nr:restriction endonuclease [Candidatus Paceibacterota bacterium]
KEALNHEGYYSRTPTGLSGKKKATGYPDIEFLDEFERINYLECKSFNIKNVNTTQRSFYLSPSSDFKITKDAHHFGISFEVFVESSIGKDSIYKLKSWKILDLEKLELDVKYEFNSDNFRLYSESLILSQRKYYY